MGQPIELVCGRCGKTFAVGVLLNLCSCGSPVLVRYDLAAVGAQWTKETLRCSIANMWRYTPVLPSETGDAVTLGEGWTPLLEARRLGRELGTTDLWIKDEGQNPTGSFKARGLSCAVTMAKKLGAHRLAIPSAGNAAGALAAYSAKAGLEAYIFMPSDVPQSNFVECMATGANVTLVDGLISDCGRLVSERQGKENWFEVSTLKEPLPHRGQEDDGI